MRMIRGLAGVLGVWLLFNMVAMAVWWGGVNAESGARFGIQLAILMGFGLILVFDLASGILLLSRSCFLRDKQGGDTGRGACHDGWLLILALFSVMGLAGAKVMVDEIARETALDWGAGGEWAVLYICLSMQLAYLLALFFLPPRPGRRV